MNNTWKHILDNLDKSKSPSEEGDNTLIVDSMNTFFRCFSAINQVNPEGTHIGGLVGYLKSIGFIIRTLKPTKIILVFDGEGSTVNKKYLYPDYKANRNITQIKNWNFDSKEEETEAIINQLGRLINYLHTLPVHILSIPKIEADDVIGYLSQNISGKITIMSADTDFFQLLSKDVTIYSPTKKIFYTPERFHEEYGIFHYNYVLYKTFLGDKSDNIPKIKGFGEDKLFKLLPEIKNYDLLTLNESINIIQNKDNKWKDKIINFLPQLKINQQLIELKNTQIPEDDLQKINYAIQNPPSCLQKDVFMTYYYEDKLGDSIPMVKVWLESTFGYLKSL